MPSQPTVTLNALDVPPAGAGFVIVTSTVPDAARTELGSVAIICVGETYDAVSAVLPACVVDEGKNPLPAIVICALGEPTTMVPGVMPVIAGTGLPTTKLTVFDVPPPGSGFTTPT